MSRGELEVALYDRKLVAERLELLRLALDLRPAELARKWGITPQGVNNYLKGDQLPSVAMACKLEERTGATLDWLYLGKTSTLPRHLADKMDSIKPEPPAPHRNKNGSTRSRPKSPEG